ncbi:MAG: hypothetical protein NTV48_02755 [Candidatus Vogelbacteria bacterium]|nr:hypothetical protein [Candidatus Vogelbacteria bacterium]
MKKNLVIAMVVLMIVATPAFAGGRHHHGHNDGRVAVGVGLGILGVAAITSAIINPPDVVYVAPRPVYYQPVCVSAPMYVAEPVYVPAPRVYYTETCQDQINAQRRYEQDVHNAQNRAYQDQVNAQNRAYQDQVNAQRRAEQDQVNAQNRAYQNQPHRITPPMTHGGGRTPNHR